MSSTPKEAKDPTEAAMSAIQEALNVRDAEMKAGPAPLRPATARNNIASNVAPAAAPSAAAIAAVAAAVAPPAPATPAAAPAGAPSSGSAIEAPRRATRTHPTVADDDLFDFMRTASPEPGRAANDDWKSVGQILQAMQPRASRKTHTWATAAAAIWLTGAAFLAYNYLPAPRENFIAVIAFAVGAVVPPVFFYLLELMLNRSREMRQIAQSMGAVAMRLAEPEAVACESIVTVGQVIRREVAAMGDGVERALARAAELETIVRDQVTALERAYDENEVRMRGLLGELTRQRDHLVAQAEHVRGSITSVQLGLHHDINNVSDMVAAQVNDAAQQVTQTLADKGQHLTMAFGRTGDTMIAALDERGGDLLQRLERTSIETQQALASVSEQLTAASRDLSASLEFKTDHIPQEFEVLADNLTQMMQLRLAGVTRDFEQRAAALLEQMNERSQEIATGLIDMSGQAADAIKTTGDSLVLDLSLRGGDVVSKVEQSGQKISEDIRSSLASFEEVFGRNATQLNEKVAHDSARLGNLIVRHLGEFDHTVKVFGGELVDKIGERTQNLADHIRGHADSFGDAIGSKAAEVNETLDLRLTRFQDALDSRTQTLNDAMTARVLDIARTLADGGKEVITAMDKRIGDQTAAINERSAKLAESIEELLAGRSEAAALQIETRARAAADAIVATTGALRTSTDELRQNASEIEQKLLAVSSEITRTLAADSSPLLGVLTTKAHEFSGELDRATQEAVKSIEAKGFDFTRTMLDNSGTLARMINEAGETASRKVNETFSGLYDTATTTIAKSQEVASGAVKEMLEAHNTLRNDTAGLFERLREANILLQEVLTGAHENMAALESTLTNRASEFTTALTEITDRSNATTERVSVHVDAFRGDAARVLGDLGALATQFETHGRVLVEAVDLIDKTNTRTEDIVTKRKTTLEQLAAALDQSSQDLEQRLTRFSSLLDESLENATARAREIGRMVAETSATGSSSITEQFDLVRNTTENVFKRTSEQFSETLQGIRTMAGDMQRELENTRAEMRRDILDLPHEAAESTAQMRRVIVDQIEALAELNAIVSRHGRNLDTAEAHRAEPRLAVVGGRNEPPARPYRSDLPPPPPDMPRGPLSPVAQTPPPSMREAPAQPPGRGTGGWLSELLHRAEQPPAPIDQRGRGPAPRDDQRRPPIDSLDALSIDIARMVDHDAAAHAWDRYNRGDHNAFGRQLYTPHGQRAFDDIRLRYRNRPDFRQTVDRYIGEFERLLEDVSRDERGGEQMVRNYLTSETGKVYTLLAHASGRFD